jgi:hypothetical protein
VKEMALCSYKYKDDKYDEIINDSSIKKGIMYGVCYEFKTNTHDFFTFEYAILSETFGEKTIVTYRVIASNFNPLNVGYPCFYDTLPISGITAINFEGKEGIHPFTETDEYILGFWPDDRARLVSEFNKYLDSKIHKYHAAKL